MILIGTMGITTKREEGQFFCPNCARQSHFRRRVKRNFLTIYFIPLIPLDIASDEVTCTSCGGEMSAEVLEFDPQAYRQEFLGHLRRVLYLLMLADGRINEPQMSAIQREYRRFAGHELPRQIMEAEIAELRMHDISAAEYVQRIELRLGEPAKDLVVQVAFVTATAAGDLSHAQQQELGKFPAALGISETRFRALIEKALQDA